jgi:hypothetical protein
LFDYLSTFEDSKRQNSFGAPIFDVNVPFKIVRRVLAADRAERPAIIMYPVICAFDLEMLTLDAIFPTSPTYDPRGATSATVCRQVNISPAGLPGSTFEEWPADTWKR